MQHAFHLADHLAGYATRTPALFAEYVRGQLARDGVSEPVVWQLRGLGYSELPWREVNRIIRDAIVARGHAVISEWFTTTPGPDWTHS